jgi:hypothetical protein
MKVTDLISTLFEYTEEKRIPRPPFRSKVFRAFAPGQRYCVDFADDFKSDGWEQYDTSQDAHYFGCWVNPLRRMILTYCEGDWTLTVFEDYMAYNGEIASMNQFYEEGFEFKTIDLDGTLTVYRQDRSRFFVKELAPAGGLA